jgi:hypothetical protein
VSINKETVRVNKGFSCKETQWIAGTTDRKKREVGLPGTGYRILVLNVSQNKKEVKWYRYMLWRRFG